ARPTGDDSTALGEEDGRSARRPAGGIEDPGGGHLRPPLRRERAEVDDGVGKRADRRKGGAFGAVASRARLHLTPAFFAYRAPRPQGGCGRGSAGSRLRTPDQLPCPPLRVPPPRASSHQGELRA